MTAARHWIGRRSVAFLVAVCAAISVAAFVIAMVSFVRQSQADAVRAADRKAQAVSSVSTCYQRVDNAPRLVRILGLIDLLATNSIVANQQAIEQSPTGDPLTPVRRASLERLVPARAALRTFIASTVQGAPTEASCRALASTLGVSGKRPKGA